MIQELRIERKKKSPDSRFRIPASAQKGQAMITASLFFLIISMTVTFGVVSPVLNQIDTVRGFNRSSNGFYAAQAVAEDVMYRLAKGMLVPQTVTLGIDGSFATATTTDVSGGKEVVSAGHKDNHIRTIKTHLTVGSGASFHYGVQSGDGGIILENNSSVLGNVYSNGPVSGTGSNIIKGDVVSAGAAGLIDGVHATSSAYAHTITGATVDKDAYYTSISGSTVSGTLFPNSPDQATSSLPIPDSMIDDWKAEAAAGGTLSSPCPYKINADTSLGPKKIACDLEISDGTITLGGAIWVEGNITFKNTPILQVSSLLGNKSLAIVADKASNRTTSSKILLENSAQFNGSGPNSYILMVSQNNSAEIGGTEKAIEVQNSVTGDLLVYAGHGEVLLQNSVDLKEVTAYRIRLKNSAEVAYESGLANLLFTSGPGGGYVFDKWREIE